MARPSKKTPQRVAKTLELVAKGKTNEQIAKIIGVTPSTIGHWLAMDFELSVAVRELRLEADELIETSLYKRAHGFEKKIKTQRVTKDGDVVDVEETQYFPPDPQALKFWLMNRQREKWGEKLALSNLDGSPLAIVVKNYVEKKQDEPTGSG